MYLDALLEMPEPGRHHEAAALRIDVAVAHVHLLFDEEPVRHDHMQMSLVRAMATYTSRRFPWISSSLPVSMSDGMQPSTTFSTCAAFHACPLAEWMADRFS